MLYSPSTPGGFYCAYSAPSPAPPSNRPTYLQDLRTPSRQQFIAEGLGAHRWLAAVGRISWMLALLLFAPSRLAAWEQPSVLRWAMLNVCGPIGQADCHLLTLPDGRHVLIDAAEAGDAPGAAVMQLRRMGVTEIAVVVLSHFHADHYGRLLTILDSGIKVDRVVVSIPGDRRIADRELPWGCNFDDVQAVLANLTARGVPYGVPRAGEHLIDFIGADGTTGELEVICAYDGIATPIGETDINDTSIVLRVRMGSTRALFTGDLNHAMGAYLARSGLDLAADILKAPHHGTEGAPPNEFFDRVAADVLMVPAPKSLWFSERSRRIREYFQSREVPAWVSGLDGIVVVTMTAEDYRIVTENSGELARLAAPPQIVVPPKSSEAQTGTSLTLAVAAVGNPALSYQWRKNGQLIPGANSNTLHLSEVRDTDAGWYRVRVQNELGCAVSAPAGVRVVAAGVAPVPTRLVNLSARAWVGAGDGRVIAGFTIGGSGAKRVLVRAIGPGLMSFGLQRPLPNPRLALTTAAGTLIADNDDWCRGADAVALMEAFQSSGAFALQPESGDAALVTWLSRGSYTVLVSSADENTGVALAEVYDLDPMAPSQLINLSGRAMVRPGDEALIAGYVVQGDTPRSVLTRAIGPSLGSFGLSGVLARPQLWMHRANGTLLLRQSNWGAASDPQALTSAFARTGAFALDPQSADAAAVLEHTSGAYTASAMAEHGESGIALVELFALP